MFGQNTALWSINKILFANSNLIHEYGCACLPQVQSGWIPRIQQWSQRRSCSEQRRPSKQQLRSSSNSNPEPSQRWVTVWWINEERGDGDNRVNIMLKRKTTCQKAFFHFFYSLKLSKILFLSAVSGNKEEIFIMKLIKVFHHDRWCVDRNTLLQENVLTWKFKVWMENHS